MRFDFYRRSFFESVALSGSAPRWLSYLLSLSRQRKSAKKGDPRRRLPLSRVCLSAGLITCCARTIKHLFPPSCPAPAAAP